MHCKQKLDADTDKYFFLSLRKIFIFIGLCWLFIPNSVQSTSEQKYVLSVGEQDEERLEILNEVFNPSTLEFIQSCGMREGMKVLDVACGTGIVSCEIAKIVGSRGKVVCVDNSEEQLQLARERAQREGITNIEFICLSAFELDQLEEKFDAVYCRFLLMHLQTPEKVLDQFRSVLIDNGLLFLGEGMGVDTFDCLPNRCQAFEDYYTLAKRRYVLQKSNSAIGRVLPKMLMDKGWHLKKSLLVHPVLSTTREKSLLRLGVQSYCASKESELANDYRSLADELYSNVENSEEIHLLYIEMNLIAAEKP